MPRSKQKITKIYGRTFNYLVFLCNGDPHNTHVVDATQANWCNSRIHHRRCVAQFAHQYFEFTAFCPNLVAALVSTGVHSTRALSELVPEASQHVAVALTGTLLQICARKNGEAPHTPARQSSGGEVAASNENSGRHPASRDCSKQGT